MQLGHEKKCKNAEKDEENDYLDLNNATKKLFYPDEEKAEVISYCFPDGTIRIFPCCYECRTPLLPDEKTDNSTAKEVYEHKNGKQTNIKVPMCVDCAEEAKPQNRHRTFISTYRRVELKKSAKIYDYNGLKSPPELSLLPH